MTNSAAAIAQKLSQHDTKNKAADVIADNEDVVGGIEEVPEKEEPVTPPVSGTPFDLVPGRPHVDFFGPLPNYGFVTTPHGEYAIPAGKLMRFETRQEWDKKEGVMVTRAYPVYEQAPQELIDYIAEPLEAIA